MTPEEAMAFLHEHGVVLASAKGPVPRLAEAVAGEPIKGSWWAHARGHDIFAVFQALQGSPDVLVCRLVGGKVTYVHRRLWPALIRAAGNFPMKDVARVVEQHTVAGHHVTREVPFPEWADPESIAMAAALSETEALAALGAWAAARRR